MKDLKNQKVVLLAVAFCLSCTWSCSYDFPEIPEEQERSLQDADLSNTVFLGGSLFSGVADGTLVQGTSSQSIPQIFLNSLQINEGIVTDFSASSDNQTGFNVYRNQNLTETVGPYELVYPVEADTTFFQRFVDGEPFSYAEFNQSLRNYSFPKAQVLDFTQATRNENQFINDYIPANPQPLISQIAATQPSLFVLNLGYEDLMGYALQGAEGNPDQSDMAAHTYDDLLNETAFRSQLQSVVDELLNSNANTKGALCNIPDFLDFPYFNQVGHRITEYIIGNPTLFAQTRQSSAEYNNLIRDHNLLNPGADVRRPQIRWSETEQLFWGVVVTDRDLADVTFNGQVVPKVRHAQQNERIFYPLERFLLNSRGMMYTNALTESEYLKVDDVNLIQTRINAYNAIIEDIVAQSNGRLALIDIKAQFDILYEGFDSILRTPADGIEIDGAPYFPVVGEYGIFSSDGINLNPRGNALIVNKIIDDLNTAFNGNLGAVNPNEFAGTAIKTDSN